MLIPRAAATSETRTAARPTRSTSAIAASRISSRRTSTFVASESAAAGHSTASRKARVSALPGRADQLGRRPLLEDPALVEERHPVGHLAREAHLVGHHHHRHVQLGGQRLHHRQHLAGELGVQRRRGLVEQHHVGLHAERAGDRDALLLAPGQPDRVLACLVGQADAVEEVLAALVMSASVPRLAHRAAQVTFSSTVMFGNRLNCWKTMPTCSRSCRICSRLRRVRCPPLEPDAGHLDRALGRVLDEVHAAQHGRLAGARPAEDHHHLAPVHLQVDAADHLEVAEALVQAVDADHDVAAPVPRGHQCGSCGAAWRGRRGLGRTRARSAARAGPGRT